MFVLTYVVVLDVGNECENIAAPSLKSSFNVARPSKQKAFFCFIELAKKGWGLGLSLAAC
jgi:hypothetical protein